MVKNFKELLEKGVEKLKVRFLNGVVEEFFFSFF